MSKGFCRSAVVAALAFVGLAPAAAAQTTYPSVKVTGRLQEQFYFFKDDDNVVSGPESNFFTRRARIEAKGQIAENVYFVIQPSFEGGRTSSTTCAAIPAVPATPSCTTRGGIRLRDAYIDVRLTKAEAKTSFTLRAGQEKRPFGRYELTSSTNLPSIERGAGNGLVASASNDLFTSNGFLSHDVGAALIVASKLDDTRLVTLQVGGYNGQGESASDVNNGKSFGARATVGVTPKLNVGAAFFSHDGIVGTDSAHKNKAFGFDAAWSKPGEAGLYLVGDFMSGESAANSDVKIRGISVIGAYNIRMTSPTSLLYAIEPAVRFDSSDPNTDVADNGSTLLTAVLGLYFNSKTQLRIAYETQNPQAAGLSTISGVRTGLAINF